MVESVRVEGLFPVLVEFLLGFVAAVFDVLVVWGYTVAEESVRGWQAVDEIYVEGWDAQVIRSFVSILIFQIFFLYLLA